MSSSPDSKVCRLTVLCSGNGSNLQALIDACESGKIPRSKIIKVIVNRKNAYATTRAANAGIPTQYFNLVSGGFQQKGEKDEAKLKDARARYDAALADVILQDKPDLVVLAGWMHVFSQPFLTPLDAANVQAINLHPALPGQYDGANAIGRAYQDFQDGKLENGRTGIMIHHVCLEVDRGAPIMTQEIECREGESLEDLETRIHAAEHDLIVKATAQKVEDILSGKASR
ncbi:phosphoribosylglycinamide formyltransferase [Plectosphaerella cucumerina]|uniref:Phosphoribosylglycinamide formyltransferase n=1 Tax=Plectosphaerella cucumerina TaxID=40658 RepID=A0A8K0TMH7_9PEZI|nr:phosphoribosylglycinamide formyltransferase [Plectosphaerella cucumerina]